jgi:hypothetical protein
MAKTSGLGATIVVADSGASNRTITNDVTNFAIQTPVAQYDWTGADKSAHERGQGLADLTFTLNGVLNNASNMSHMVLSTMSSTSVPRLVTVTPTSNAHPFITATTNIQSYDVTRANDGNLTWAASLVLQDGSLPSWTNS